MGSSIIPFILSFNFLVPKSYFWRTFMSFSGNIFVYLSGIIFLILAIRILLVVIYSYSKYWKKRETVTLEEVEKIAHEKNVSLPFFTIIIPAKDDSDVVAPTIETFLEINYPRDKYEVAVVTDQKETLKAKEGEITTQTEVARMQEKYKDSQPDFHLCHYDVPYDFDGEISGKCLGHEVASTKGRAINWAFTEHDKQSLKKPTFYAFFDTDAHPNAQSFLAVAKTFLLDNSKRVFQLPVFQVRNFCAISNFSKLAAIGQAFSHQTFLPYMFVYMPFVGGTNLFIERNLIWAVRGINPYTITDDLDLGTRMYLQEDAWPQYLPYPSSEQTPATIKMYVKQRKRWGMGQLLMITDLSRWSHKLPDNLKNVKDIKKKIKRLYWAYIWHGPTQYLSYFFLTMLSLVSLTSRTINGVISLFSIGNKWSYFSISKTTFGFMSWFFSNIPIPLMLYSIVLLIAYRQYIAWPENNTWKKQTFWYLIAQFTYMPFILFLYSWPYVSGFIDYYILRKRNPQWIKTPRTKG